MALIKLIVVNKECSRNSGAYEWTGWKMEEMEKSKTRPVWGFKF